MKTESKILGIIFIYCAIFAWMSVPFVTTDKTMFRKQVMFIDNLQDEIVSDAPVLASR